MESQPNYAIPLSIVIAGLLIASAIYFGGNGKANLNNQQPDLVPIAQYTKPGAPNDHIIGASLAKAKVAIIVYSDLECPFCKIFDRAVMPLTASSTDIALVYRHFPIDANHKQARAEAEYAACVAQTAGNDAFWQFVNNVFETTKSNDGLDLNNMPTLATKAGAKVTDVEKCVKDGTGNKIVKADEETGKASGLNGTPFVIAVDLSNNQAISLMESKPTAIKNPIIKDFYQKLLTNWDKETQRFAKEAKANQDK